MSAARRFTLVPRLETYPALVRVVQSVPGKLALLAVFAFGLWLHARPWWAEMAAILAVISLWPARRRVLILAGTSYWLFQHSPFAWSGVRSLAARCGVLDRIDWQILRPAALLATIAFCIVFSFSLRWRTRVPLLRRPIALVLTLYVVLACVATATAIDGMLRVCLFAFVVVLGRYLWFLACSALYPAGASNPLLVVGQFLPFWSAWVSSPIPFPKAAGYLDKIEAKNAEELAVCQLKALKLLIWAGILVLLRKFCIDLSNGPGPGPLSVLGLRAGLELPSAVTLLADSAAGHPRSAATAILSLLANFADALLQLSIWGHVVIACCRASGFKALRNTYRPLESATIAEFWNRYYFYFKEVLVDVFFYPTYLRYFKKHPRLRRFVATLAAASFGNFLYHYLRDLEFMSIHGPWQALLAKSNYMFYCAVLGLAIGVSQLRVRLDLVDQHWTKRHLLRPSLVVGFYCLLSVFEIPGPAGLGERFELVLSVFGVRGP